MRELNMKRSSMAVVSLVFIFLIVTTSASAFIDLAINSTSIQFSNNNPIEGETITINTTVTNLGNENATNVTVQFLDDFIEIGNTLINVPAFSTAVTSQFWEAEIGPNTIIIIVDPNNVIVESDETNNDAFKDISISAYHTYYGITKSYLGLGIESDFLIRNEMLGCNLLIADTDSNVDFSLLQAIGRRKRFGRALNDFKDIDKLLGMEDFDDSVSNLYTKNGWRPKKVETFTVFDDIIRNVPVVDSTNSSTFKTGILWDTSDDTNITFGWGWWRRFGQFDTVDQEDLVFVTKINPSQVGQYGIYDYEIKIPALLRDYKSGSPSIDFYIDLDSFPCS